MISPTKADIGRGVLYRPRSPAKPEAGRLVSFNTLFAFVRFGTSATPQGCRFADLEWEFPAAKTAAPAPARDEDDDGGEEIAEAIVAIAGAVVDTVLAAGRSAASGTASDEEPAEPAGPADDVLSSITDAFSTGGSDSGDTFDTGGEF